MEVRLILAANGRGVIGDKGHLLWHIAGDLNRFNLIRQKSSTSKVGDEGGSGEFT